MKPSSAQFPESAIQASGHHHLFRILPFRAVLFTRCSLPRCPLPRPGVRCVTFFARRSM